jgi:hypothetical protein
MAGSKIRWSCSFNLVEYPAPVNRWGWFITLVPLERLFEPDFSISPELIEPIPERWVDHLVEIIGDYIY